jgi:hypothetical protein
MLAARLHPRLTRPVRPLRYGLCPRGAVGGGRPPPPPPPTPLSRRPSPGLAKARLQDITEGHDGSYRITLMPPSS